MLRIDHKRAQAATELAVFGAILIFLLGTIVRTALSNSYTQNQNFKAMCMAMLASWKGSTQGNVAHNSASILFVEDRLSPDFNKYGSLDRTPYIAMGSGSFSYMMMYPVDRGDLQNTIANLPIMDIYINGQHFPFTTAWYFDSVTLSPEPLSYCKSKYPPGCQQNQCLRSNREWVGGVTGQSTVTETSFDVPSVAPGTTDPTITDEQRKCQMQSNACTVFTDLSRAGIFTSSITGDCSSNCGNVLAASTATLAVQAPVQDSPEWGKFMSIYQASFPNNTTGSDSSFYTPYFTSILSLLQQINSGYKLFYSIVPNPGPNSTGTQFSPVPPVQNCSSPPCPLQALTKDIQVMDQNENVAKWNGVDTVRGDHTGDMMYDLLRMGDYSATGVENPSSQFGPPLDGTCASTGDGIGYDLSTMMRCYIGWQWAASAAVSPQAIGLVTTEHAYPTMDIDGRLKPVTIFSISAVTNPPAGTPPSVTVSYEDYQSGDIDETWDTNTCGPKPGLQNTAQVLTYTKDGTYLLINEGKLYNPETGQVVRSADKRDNVDLIQRAIQLSNNTGRFCTTTNPPTWGTLGAPVSMGGTNPVEACVNESPCNCFIGDGSPLASQCGVTIKETCYDTYSGVNTIFVRSRLQDLRGRFWMTDTSGQLKVH